MDDISNKLQKILKVQIGKGNIFNAVAAVQSQDREIDFVGAAGIADPVTGKAMTPEMPYFIASVSKMYTAVIIMRLSEEKRLDLDAPIVKYLPDSLTRGIHIYKGVDYSDRIIVRQLVNQGSGLADHEMDKPRHGKSVMDELKAGHDRAIDTTEVMEIERSLTPHFPPGTPGKAYYSNANYRLLGAIIESITEKSMAANYDEFIVEPLGLQHTYLYDAATPRPGEKPATIYLNRAPAYVPKYLASNVSDGGLVSTSRECMKFLRAFFEGQLFRKEHLNMMMTWNPIFFPMRYGYGLMDFRLPRFFWPTPLPEFIGHSGSTGSFAFFSPAKSLYLTGTVNQIAGPQKPFMLMTNLVQAIKK